MHMLVRIAAGLIEHVRITNSPNRGTHAIALWSSTDLGTQRRRKKRKRSFKSIHSGPTIKQGKVKQHNVI
jgi:hypothetical protein